MPGFSAQISINAPARRVFDFVSGVENMPRYLPEVEKAALAGEDHIRLLGVVRGADYALEGPFTIDEDALRMSWRSNDPHKYQGDFQAFDTEEGSELACRIEFEPHLETMERLAGASGTGADFIEAKLNAVLQNIKREVESLPEAAGKAEEPDLADDKKAGYKLIF
jgi:ribosome-associated toxin RatA of RatAB toxin-antitoxin module